MKVKDQTVNFDGITIEMLKGLCVVHKVFDELEYELTITSCRDGSHKQGSKHYSGNAVDVRVWGIPERHRESVCCALRMQLRSNYDVVYEGNHIHIEYDPKIL